jgi:hypothetical protein
LGALEIRQARVSTGWMSKPTAEAEVTLGKGSTSRPHLPSAPH